MDGKVYLIERIDAGTFDNRFYAEHGEVGGVKDAIGYETAMHARKFRTEDEARHFIQNQLPEWGQNSHRAVGYGFADFPMGAVELTSMLWFGIEIPDHLLEPTAGRLRLWER